MDLKYLNTFQTVVEEGGFSRAAEKLNYTQSTITFQIGQLEQELSTRLFEKLGRRMVLTKAGEQLLPYVKNVLSSVEQLRFFESDLAQCRGDLYIGIGESLLCYRIPAILKEFHSRAPRARLFLRSMNCCDIRDALLGGGLDLGVFYEDVGGFGSMLTAYPCGAYPITLVASPANRRRFPDFDSPDRKLPLPLVINEADCVYRRMLEQYLCRQSILLDYTVELWSIPTIKNLVKNDMGVSILPKFAVQEELDRGELEEIPIHMPSMQITAVCAHHKNKWVSPLMQLFLDLCRDGRM